MHSLGIHVHERFGNSFKLLQILIISKQDLMMKPACLTQKCARGDYVRSGRPCLLG